MKIKIDLSDPETRAIWETAWAARREVESWPAWKRGETMYGNEAIVSTNPRDHLTEDEKEHPGAAIRAALYRVLEAETVAQAGKDIGIAIACLDMVGEDMGAWWDGDTMRLENWQRAAREALVSLDMATDDVRAVVASYEE